MTKKTQDSVRTEIETVGSAGVYESPEEARAAQAENARNLAEHGSASPRKSLRNTVTVLGAAVEKGEAWKHAAAAALHGWAEHAHHEGKPMELEPEDYAAALKAAEAPNAEGEYVPHAPALSKHAAIANRI